MAKVKKNLDWAKNILKDDCPDDEEERFWLEVGLDKSDGLWHIRLRSNRKGVVMQTVKGYKRQSQAEVMAARILILFPNTVEILKNRR